MSKTFSMMTLGCKVNSVESDRYALAMKHANYTQVDFKQPADVVIINTCAVTHAAAAKSRQKIAAAIKINPDANLVVVGCSIAADFENIAKFKEINTLIYQDQKEDFAKLVLNQEEDTKTIETNQSKTRAFLKIQDGCEQFCSYCVIPIARGPETSITIDKLMETARLLVEAKHKEIVLTGIHIGRYGIQHDHSLLDLLKELVQIDGLERIRISSIEVTELPDDLLTFIASQPKIAKHFHIPLQAGNNRVLQSMNRPYTVEDFKRVVSTIKTLMPDAVISSDVIAGFVGESEAEFQDTLANIKQIDFSFLHVFPYSKRQFTPAATFTGHLSAATIKERAQHLRALSKTLRQKFLQQYQGQVVRVLVEHPTKEGYFGHSEHYCPVIIQDEVDLNEMVDVRIQSVDDSVCYGKLVRSPYVTQ